MQLDFNECDIMEMEDTQVIRWGNRWHSIKYKKEGSYLKVFVCPDIALKTLKNTSSTELKEAFKESERTGKILNRVNPKSDAAGIQEKPISPLSWRTFTVYETKEGVLRKKDVKTPIQVERAFISDCHPQSITIPPEEIPWVTACLIQGSKALIQNDVYHLDTKPENMAYFGDGDARHFDIGGSKDLRSESWRKEFFTFTKEYLFREERQNIKYWTDLEQAKQKLTAVHIFQPGISFYEMETKQRPYHKSVAGYLSPVLASSQNDLIRKLRKAGVYTEAQASTIAKMLSINPSNRPSLVEIEEVFPYSRFKARNRTPPFDELSEPILAPSRVKKTNPV